MKVTLFFVGVISSSLLAFTASAQNASTDVVSFYYVNQPAASVGSDDNSTTQALSLNAKPEPKAAFDGTATEKATTKTMSEELSAWVDNKKAVVNSYKRSKRRK